MVNVGDTIAEEQSRSRLKVTRLQWSPSTFAGVVKEIKIAVGDKVSTGSLIMVFEVAGSAPAPSASAPAPAASAPAALCY